MDISVNITGSAHLLEAVQEALEGAVSFVQNLTFGPYKYTDIAQSTTNSTDEHVDRLMTEVVTCTCTCTPTKTPMTDFPSLLSTFASSAAQMDELFSPPSPTTCTSLTHLPTHPSVCLPSVCARTTSSSVLDALWATPPPSRPGYMSSPELFPSTPSPAVCVSSPELFSTPSPSRPPPPTSSSSFLDELFRTSTPPRSRLFSVSASVSVRPPTSRQPPSLCLSPSSPEFMDQLFS